MLKKKYLAITIAIVLLIFLRVLFVIKNTFHISLVKTLFGIDSLRTLDRKVNFLVLGIPGGSYDGPNLSDSMIIFTYDFNKNKIFTLSIPRDVWSDTLKDRLNSAYAYGESIKRGGGLILAKAEVGAIIGMPIQYAAAINFDNFKELIDFFGGIDVDIKNSFIDKKYPIEGKENDNCKGDEDYKCRYETIRFEKGVMHMNGDTALKFVRSRNAQGAEGSDFARVKRQQLVIESLQKKLLKETNVLNSKKMKLVFNKIDNSLERDFTNQQILSTFKKIFFKGVPEQIKIEFPRNLFTTPSYLSYDGRYVLTPINDDYSKVHDYVRCMLDEIKEKCE